MKKLKEIFDKYIIHVGLILLTAFGTFLWDYSQRFFSLPDKVDTINNQRIEDSTFASKYMHRNDSVIRVLQLWESQDFDSIVSIQNKLKRNKIK